MRQRRRKGRAIGASAYNPAVAAAPRAASTMSFFVQQPVFTAITKLSSSKIMSAQLIDGVLLSQQLRAEIAQRAAALTAKGNKPGLAVILVGEDPASHVYVRNKVKACGDVGFHSILE